jgi:hypothetical protein
MTGTTILGLVFIVLGVVFVAVGWQGWDEPRLRVTSTSMTSRVPLVSGDQLVSDGPANRLDLAMGGGMKPLPVFGFVAEGANTGEYTNGDGVMRYVLNGRDVTYSEFAS